MLKISSSDLKKIKFRSFNPTEFLTLPCDLQVHCVYDLLMP